MLVLKRKAGESFTIDGQIKIKILGDFGHVRIGIEAPSDMRILRDELINNAQYKNEKSTQHGTSNENTRSE